MQGSQNRGNGRKRGPEPFKPTKQQRADVALYVGGGMSEPAIAREIGICQNTLRKHFGVELREGHQRASAENLRRLRAAADDGNVAAMKHLDSKFDRVAAPPGEPKARVRPLGRKEVAHEAALAAGDDSDWGDDLKPPGVLPN